MNILLKIYKISEKLKRLALSIWLSYLAGISTEYISNSSSFSGSEWDVDDRFLKISIVSAFLGSSVIYLSISFVVFIFLTYIIFL